jgi:hypothetical protein
MTETIPNGEVEHVEARILGVTVPPLRVVCESEMQEETFTRGDFEGALDRVSRPLRGRLAHVPYSSEDFIREKREEAELEDHPS